MLRVLPSSLRIVVGSLTASVPTPRFVAGASVTWIPAHDRAVRLLSTPTNPVFLPRLAFISAAAAAGRKQKEIEPRATITTVAAAPSSPIFTMNGPNSAPRSKRKDPPQALEGRHTKHHRALNGRDSAGDNTPDVEDDFEEIEEYEMDDARLQALLPAGPDTAEWQATIENVVRNVVSIRFCLTASFDTEPALTSEATGFVVDAERG